MGIISSDWTKKKKLTIQSSKVSASETNITCYISVTDSDFASSASSDGGDFRIATGGEATQLALAVIEYDDSTGKLVAAFKADTISSSVNTDFYLYYGNSAVSMPASDSTYGSEAAFDSSYDAAYINRSDLSLTVSDLTVNNYDMTLSSSSFQEFKYTSVSNVGPSAHQCCTFDGSYYYFVDTNYLYKRSTIDGSNLATNSDPCGDVNTELSVSTDHCGAGVAYGGYLYFAVERYSDCDDNDSPCIARFNLSDLSFDAAWDISSNGYEASGLCIDSSAGTNGIIYVCSYCSRVIQKYDLATPSSHLGDIAVDPSGTLYSQGLCIYKDSFIVAANYTDYLEQYSFDGTFICNLTDSNSTLGQGGESVFEFEGSFYEWDGVGHRLYKFSRPNDDSIFGAQFFAGRNNYAAVSYTLPSTGTIQCFMSPVEYFNYNSLWDNSGDGNKWEAWCYDDGRLGQRIGSSRIYDLDNLGTVADTYLTSFGWTKDGTSVDAANMVNGVVRDSGSESWVAPGTTCYLNGGNSGNSNGENEYYAVFLRNIDLAKDADLALTEFNNIDSPTTFIVFSAEENNVAPSGWQHKILGITPTKVYGVEPTKVMGV